MPPPSDVVSLLDENQRLRVRLKSCDVARRRAERQLAELQVRVHQAEIVAAQERRRKEAEWMAEYDSSVQALLKIVQHHEDETKQLEAEVKRLRAATAVVPPSITKMTRSAQTEAPRPVKVAPRRNSVHFAKEEEAVSGKEERPVVDAKTKASIARMQLLFEQLQVSSDQRDTSLVNRVDEGLDAEPTQASNEHHPVDPSCSFKAIVLERLGEHQAEASTVRRRRSTTAKYEDNKTKRVETPTDEMPVSKQEMPANALQQDLEECNRLLHERLASQQKVLDHLLDIKLQRANGATEQYDPVPPTRSDLARTPTMNPAAYIPPNGGVRIEPVAGTTERRPLSPQAA